MTRFSTKASKHRYYKKLTIAIVRFSRSIRKMKLCSYHEYVDITATATADELRKLIRKS